MRVGVPEIFVGVLLEALLVVGVNWLVDTFSASLLALILASSLANIFALAFRCSERIRNAD